MSSGLPKLPKGSTRNQSPAKASAASSPAPSKSDGGSAKNSSNRSKSPAPAPPLLSPEGRSKTPRKNKVVTPGAKSAAASPDDASVTSTPGKGAAKKGKGSAKKAGAKTPSASDDDTMSVASTKSAGKGGRTTPTPGAKKKKGAGASKADADDDKSVASQESKKTPAKKKGKKSVAAAASDTEGEEGALKPSLNFAPSLDLTGSESKAATTTKKKGTKKKQAEADESTDADRPISPMPASPSPVPSSPRPSSAPSSSSAATSAPAAAKVDATLSEASVINIENESVNENKPDNIQIEVTPAKKTRKSVANISDESRQLSSNSSSLVSPSAGLDNEISNSKPSAAVAREPSPTQSSRRSIVGRPSYMSERVGSMAQRGSVFRKGGDMTQLFQQHIAAWKIRFFMEIVIRKNQIQSYKDEVASQKKQIKLLQKKVEEARDKSKESERAVQLEEEVAFLRREKERFEETEKEDRKRKIKGDAAMESSLQALRNELMACKEELKITQEQKQEVSGQLEKISAKQTMENNQLEQANTTIILLQENLKDLRAKVARNDANIEIAGTERSKILVELEASRSKVTAAEVEVQKLRQTIEKNETEKKSLERLITEITVNVHAREKKITELKGELDVKGNTIDELRDRISANAHEKNLMAQRIIAVEKLQRKFQTSLASANLECDRNGMRCAELEHNVARAVKAAASAKQYSELLQEKFEREKNNLVEAHADSERKLAEALRRAEESEAAATAYLKSSQDHRPFTQGTSYSSRPVSSHFARAFEDYENADYGLDDMEVALSQRMLHSRPMTGPAMQPSPFPSGRTYGIPNIATPGQLSRSMDLESFEVVSRQRSADQNSQLENRLVALVSVLENRIDKMNIAATLVDELDLERIEKENGDDEVIIVPDVSEDPEVEAQRLAFDKEQESKLVSAIEKLAVLREHGHVLMKQSTELNDTLAAAQQSFDKKSMELRDVKSDYVDLQAKIVTMQQQNVAKIEDLKLWETSIMQKRGEPPTEAERMEKARDLLQSDTQIKEVYALTQEVSEEIGILSNEVSSLRDAVNALSLQKGVVETMIKDHVASEENQEILIENLKRAAETRRVEHIKSLESKAEQRRHQEERLMKRERKKAEIAEKRTSRLQKWKIFNESSRTDAEKSIEQILDSAKQTKSVVSSSSEKLLSNDPLEISTAANSLQSVKRKISSILGNIKSISFPVKHESLPDSTALVGASEEGAEGSFEEGGTLGEQIASAVTEPSVQQSLNFDLPSELSFPSDLKMRTLQELGNPLQQYTRMSDNVTSFSNTNVTAEEALKQLLSTFENVSSLAQQVQECKICIDQVSHQVRPQRLAAITDWAAAFEDQWGRRPGPADCRSTGAWSLIESYLQTQRKEYEMYLEIQAMCNEGRYRVSELQNQLANYKVLLKALANSDPLNIRIPEHDLPGLYNEATLPVSSDDIYEFHSIFVPLSLPVHDDPMKTMFSNVKSAPPALDFSDAPTQPSVVRFLEPKPVEESKDSVNYTRDSSLDVIDDDWLMSPIETNTKRPGIKSPYSAKQTTSGIDDEAAVQPIKRPGSEPIDSERDVKRLTTVTAEVESIQNELEEALKMLQDAKNEYRNQLSRQDFAAQELQEWEVSFCKANPGKEPGLLADDEKRFGGGWSLYEDYDQHLIESASLQQRVEVLVDIAVDKQLQLDDKKEELKALQEKANPSKTQSAFSSLFSPLSKGAKRSRDGKRVKLNDMATDGSEEISLHKALTEITESIKKLESEIILMENYITPCETSLEQFKQKKNKLKTQAVEWIREFSEEHGRTPTDEEKRLHIGFIYADRAALQIKETALIEQYTQAKEILEKLRRALSHKHSRLSLLKSNFK